MSKASDLRDKSGAGASPTPATPTPKLDAVTPDEHKNAGNRDTSALRGGQAQSQNAGGGKAPVGRRPKV